MIVPTVDAGSDLGDLARMFMSGVSVPALDRLSISLGVTTASLRRLRIGWTGRAWSFPMCDPRHGDRVCGIRLRFLDGSKLSVAGGKDGIFVPDSLTGDGTLLIAEGPTDTAALLDLGFDVIGRPSCQGGVRLLRHYVRSRSIAALVIVADADGPGQSGARSLGNTLAIHCRDVRIVVPPAKDAREWVRGGGTRKEMLQLIESAPLIRVVVRSTGDVT